MELPGDAVIVATGGMHGLFGNTTGSRAIQEKSPQNCSGLVFLWQMAR